MQILCDMDVDDIGAHVLTHICREF